MYCKHSDHLKEECGVFGIFGNVARFKNLSNQNRECQSILSLIF